MEDPLKIRYEEIGRQDQELHARMQALKPKMKEISGNYDAFLSRLNTVGYIEFNKNLDLMNPDEIEASTIRLNQIGSLQKEFIDSITRFLKQMQDNPTIIEDVYNFVNVLNAAYDKMATGKLTKEEVSRHLTYMETDLFEIQTRYNIFEEESFEFIKEIENLFSKLKAIES